MKAQTHLFLYPHHEFVHVGGGLDGECVFSEEYLQTLSEDCNKV